jgi:uncharacterized protein DUF2752
MTTGRKLRTSIGAAMAAGLAVLYCFPPSDYGFYPRCPIYSATHVLCPGCGGTRALYELLHLNFRGALHYNTLVTVLIPLGFLWCAFCWYNAARRGAALELRLRPGVTIALVLVASVFTVARNSGVAFSI